MLQGKQTGRGKWILGALASVIIASSAQADIRSSVDADAVSKRVSTKLGLYVTSADANAAIEASPEIVFIDVRTQAEVQFVGHPASLDANIPFRFLDPELRHDGRSAYRMVSNENFANEVRRLMIDLKMGENAPIFLICRSGGRSAAAVDILADAGFTNVWNVVDGFEGGKDQSTGHRTVEGWRAEGLPWSYTVPAGLAYPK